MGKNSAIEWTHHTFNPWWGCVKVSAGCKHCYAETWSKRVGLDLWSSKTPRRLFTDAHWAEPLRWNREAEAAGETRRVFCASMADVFERRAELDATRQRLWALIEATPSLTWLLLSKRPENVEHCVPWVNRWPKNVWLGTTVENQHWAEKRMPHLVKHPAVVRFLSCEPLLGQIDLSPWAGQFAWVIAGGESGPKSRPMKPEWVRSLRDSCGAMGVAFHFKQWGHWAPTYDSAGERLQPMGKKRAGRKLDGRTWDGLPA